MPRENQPRAFQGAIFEKLVESLSVKFAKHKDFDSFLEAIAPEEGAICLYLRDLILQNYPELRETWAYGAPYYRGKYRVCFLYPASLPYSGIEQGVNFGFNRAYLLSNAQGLLNFGYRKEVGYVPVKTLNDIQPDVFLEILHEAVMLDRF